MTDHDLRNNIEMQTDDELYKVITALMYNCRYDNDDAAEPSDIVAAHLL